MEWLPLGALALVQQAQAPVVEAPDPCSDNTPFAIQHCHGTAAPLLNIATASTAVAVNDEGSVRGSFEETQKGCRAGKAAVAMLLMIITHM